MKRLVFNLLTIVSLSTWMLSCDDNTDTNDGNELPDETVILGFDQESLTFASGEDSVYVKVNLDKEAEYDGQVSISFTGEAEYGAHFITFPALTNQLLSLDIEEGSDSVGFYVISTSAEFEGPLDLILQLQDPQEGFEIGEQRTSQILIPGATGFAYINFQYDFLHISESNTDYKITLDLSSQLAYTGSVVLQISTSSASVYGEHYTTSPAAVMNELMLQVAPNSSTVSFLFSAIDDQILRGNFELNIQVVGNDKIAAGSHAQLTLKVEENDQNQYDLISISDLRAKFEEYEGDFWLSQDFYIRGVVTSGSNVGVDNGFYLQDETGGILLKLSYPNPYKIGDDLILNLKNATSVMLNAQKAMRDVINMAVIMEENVYTAPEEITAVQFVSGNYSGKKVKVSGLSFPAAASGALFESNHNATSAQGSLTVATYSSAEFAQYPLPSTAVNITGIAGDWGYLMPQTYNADIQTF